MLSVIVRIVGEFAVVAKLTVSWHRPSGQGRALTHADLEAQCRRHGGSMLHCASIFLKSVSLGRASDSRDYSV